MFDIDAKKDALISIAKRCFETGLQTNAGGNLSVRLDSRDAIVIKPSGVGFNECTRENLQVVHLDGTIEPSEHNPSKDLSFHLDLYRIREDINAIVHCHSPWATGYASAGIEIPCLTVQTIKKKSGVCLLFRYRRAAVRRQNKKLAPFLKIPILLLQCWPIMEPSGWVQH